MGFSGKINGRGKNKNSTGVHLVVGQACYPGGSVFSFFIPGGTFLQKIIIAGGKFRCPGVFFFAVPAPMGHSQFSPFYAMYGLFILLLKK